MQISDKKKIIFQSTLELVKDHGFHGTPISLVAKKADVAAGTIYHYFESKDQLICELFEFIKNQLVTIVDDTLADDNHSFSENFFRISKNVYQFYVESPNVLIFLEQFINSPYHSAKNHVDTDGVLFKFFKYGSDNEYIKHVKPETLIVLFLGNIATLAKLNNFGETPLSDSELQQVLGILWDGIALEN